MTLESEYQRFSLVVDIFDLAVVEKTEGDVLGCLEYIGNYSPLRPTESRISQA